MLKQRAWTATEDRRLRDEYGITPLADLARDMGRTASAVKQRARRIGLSARAFWSPEEDAALRRIYPSKTAEECARWIGRSANAIHDRAHKLGLRKSREWIAEQSRLRMLDPNHPARQAQFRAGQTAWNKDMKGLQLGGEAGWFKPGTRQGRAAQLWQPIGSDRRSKEGYLQRKISDTGCTRRDFVPVHHLVWRMHGRSIPPGHALVFRDGDKTNIDINNLELLTRADLMRRNTLHRYPAEVKAAIHALAALTRKINKEDRHEQHQ